MRTALFISSLLFSASICASQAADRGTCLPFYTVNALHSISPQADNMYKESGEPESSLPLVGAAPLSSDCTSTIQTQGIGESANIDEFRFFAGSSHETIPDTPSSSKSRPHGQVYGLLGSGLMGAPDITLHDELQISDWGGSVGGELGGRTSYFASFDQFGFNKANLQSFLTSMTQHGDWGGILPAEANPAFVASMKAGIDRRFGTRDSAYLRFNRDDLHTYALAQVWTPKASGLAADFGLKQQIVAAGNTATISPNTVNETNVQAISSEAQLPPGAPELGVQSGINLLTLRRDRVFEAADNIYRQIGSQSVRAGGDFLYSQMQISFLEAGMGRSSSGDASFRQSDRSAGFYAVDEKDLRRNLLLTAGIRYDVQDLKGFRTDTNNLAPELGIAWGLSSRTVIRGGMGIYYDQIPLPAVAGSANVGESADIQESGRFVNRTGWHPGAVADFTVLPPSVQNAYAETANVDVEQQIGSRSVITAESQYLRGVQLALPPSSFNAAELCMSPTECQAGKTFSGQEIGTGASYSYQGASVAFTQNPVRWGNYKVAYTYATAEGQGVGDNMSSIDDQMRRASFTGVLHTSLEPGSGFVQRLANGFMLTGTSDYTSRSEFAGLNFINVNARLSKTLSWGQNYHLEFLAETFNMLQQTNAAFARSLALMGPNSGAFFDMYQRVASFQSPNGNQFGLRFDF